MNSVAEEKSFQFAVRIVKLYRYLARTKRELVLSKQLLRAGTSIGANVAEAEQAQSHADFVAKISIALKEAAETNYWIRLLHSTGYLSQIEYESIINDCREVERILTAILNSSKK